jgi:uncharacterized protein YjbI with pentapeptide repeats
MIQPVRAPVRPRVVSPETCDAIPLDEVLADFRAGATGAIEIVGGCGSGKTTALAHLAATVPSDGRFLFLDDASPERIVEAASGAVVVFTSRHSRDLPGAASYRLASWGEDELLEYLLAMHPARCRSVMARLQAATDRHVPEGLAELWRIVLDGMALNESLSDVSEALRSELQRALPTDDSRSLAEVNCLAVLSGRADEAAGNCCRLPQAGADVGVLRLLRHEPIQLLLAADHLKRLLETGFGQNWLAKQLPLALVEAVAAEMSSAAIENLRTWMAETPTACQAMAASLLHAVGAGWIPNCRPLPLLAGAYLAGAAWEAVDLAEARLELTDLSQSDLTEAVLSKALARKANFRGALLHRASLVEMRAEEANFESAVLTSTTAHGAVFTDAVFKGADLTGASLVRADCRRATLSDARLRDADLTWANLTGATIDGADFSSAVLHGACLNRLPLRQANFAGARFSHAQLIESDLEGMSLPGVDFEKAHMRGSLLTGSHMPRANFAGADLRAAGLADIDWEEADLRRADLRKCTFHLGTSRSGLVGSPIACEGSRTGFYGDEFDQQTYRSPEDIRKANLRGADLRGADVRGTDFYLVDLRNAKYTSEQLEHFRRCGAILFDRK